MVSSLGILRVLNISLSRRTLSSPKDSGVGRVWTPLSFIMCSLTQGHWDAAMHSGTTLSADRIILLPFTRMRLSPPIPEVAISAAVTRVLLPPMMAPSGSRRGFPSLRIPMSVVVPPMSMTMASFCPVRYMAPMRLAAGPQRMVSTGFSLARASPIMDPSPLTIIRGAWMPFSASTALTDLMRSSMTGTSLAFMMHVAVRSLKPSPDDSSWPQITGTSRISLAISLTLFSWSGLRTARYPVTATPSTLPLTDSRNFLAASSSRGWISSPWRSCPPSTTVSKSGRTEKSYSLPMQTRATLQPLPSTTEFVARVDDSDTTPTCFSSSVSKSTIEPRIPIDRSSRVVRDFALQRIFPDSRSMTTASVYVPPVSNPSPIVMITPSDGWGEWDCGTSGSRGPSGGKDVSCNRRHGFLGGLQPAGTRLGWRAEDHLLFETTPKSLFLWSTTRVI